MNLPPTLADHPLLASERDDWATARIRDTEDSVLLVRDEPGRTIALALGPQAGTLVAAEASDRRDRGVGGAQPMWLSTPQDAPPAPDVAQFLGVTPQFGWEWLAVREASALGDPQPAIALARLDRAAEDAAIREVLRIANPISTADPAANGEVEWWGAWAGARLVGVIGAKRGQGWPATGESGFSWHLHGLAVSPEARGRGAGAGLTAAIARSGFAAGADFVSLGIYSVNDVARRIYHRLGFQTQATMTAYRPTSTTP